MSTELLRVESIEYNVKGHIWHRKIQKNFASINVKNIIYIFFKLKVIRKYGKKKVERRISEMPQKQIVWKKTFKNERHHESKNVDNHI